MGHIDVIYKGVASLLDGGTYSYFIDDATFKYFQGVQSHNTLYRAAEKYSMRKLSRFVFGSWTKGRWTIIGENRLVLEFKNRFSDHFQRTFDFKKDRIIVRDKVVKSFSTDLISGLTLNSNSLGVSSKSSCKIITIKPESETSDTFSIRSNTPAVISDVPVSFCYGSKVFKKRVEFSMKNKELMFEICFKNKKAVLVFTHAAGNSELGPNARWARFAEGLEKFHIEITLVGASFFHKYQKLISASF